jgi:hypothetical protein
MTDTNQITAPAEENKQKIISSVEEITNIIKRKDASYASHYLIPSLGKEVPFDEINTAQQKRLVKSVIDSPVYNTEFIYTLRGILQENCQDDSIDIDKLTVIDKLVLAIALRIKSIGHTVGIEVETKDGANVNVDLELPKILEIALSTVSEIKDANFEDAYYKVTCTVPTVGTEYKIEKELRNNVNDIEIDNVEELRETVGEAFIGELVKYIKNVQVKGDDDVLIPVEWDSFNITNRIKVIETFKSSLLRNILEYINSVRAEIDKIELVNFDFAGEKYERRLSIDGGFFTIS